jgi:hypothetical protein
MAKVAPTAGKGSTLDAVTLAEVTADWSDAEVIAGTLESKVTMPVDPTVESFRSNRGFDVLEAARTAAKAAMGDAYTAKLAEGPFGTFIGSKTKVRKLDDGSEVLDVTTYWKQRSKAAS